MRKSVNMKVCAKRGKRRREENQRRQADGDSADIPALLSMVKLSKQCESCKPRRRGARWLLINVILIERLLRARTRIPPHGNQRTREMRAEEKAGELPHHRVKLA